MVYLSLYMYNHDFKFNTVLLIFTSGPHAVLNMNENQIKDPLHQLMVSQNSVTLNEI